MDNDYVSASRRPNEREGVEEGRRSNLFVRRRLSRENVNERETPVFNVPWCQRGVLRRITEPVNYAQKRELRSARLVAQRYLLLSFILVVNVITFVN